MNATNTKPGAVVAFFDLRTDEYVATVADADVAVSKESMTDLCKQVRGLYGDDVVIRHVSSSPKSWDRKTKQWDKIPGTRP